MGVGYFLVNLSKHEQITFAHLPVNTAKEICGNPVSAAIVSWYLIQHVNDSIRFVEDNTSRAMEYSKYPDQTDECIKELIDVKILEDRGFAWRDKDEPETVFIREVRNCWLDAV